MTDAEQTGRTPHKTIPVQVWADVDEKIAWMVRYLNTIPGVRTHASCQGTIGEGGPSPYRAQVMATWPADASERLGKEFDITLEGENWGYLHPREGTPLPAEQPSTSAQMLEPMVDRSIGKCVSGHWLPLSGNCDLCGAGPADKCLFVLGATQGDHDDQTER